MQPAWHSCTRRSPITSRRERRLDLITTIRCVPPYLTQSPHTQARRGMSQLEIEDEVATDLQRATGTADAGAGDATRLNRVLQLTGARRGPVFRADVAW